MTAPCPGQVKGEPCPHTPDASGHCALHDPARARARGRSGRAKQLEATRAERERVAAELKLDRLEDIKALWVCAARSAVLADDRRAMAELFRAATQYFAEAEFTREGRELLAQLAAHARAHGGMV